MCSGKRKGLSPQICVDDRGSGGSSRESTQMNTNQTILVVDPRSSALIRGKRVWHFRAISRGGSSEQALAWAIYILPANYFAATSVLAFASSSRSELEPWQFLINCA